jgi:hypothetical protein
MTDDSSEESRYKQVGSIEIRHRIDSIFVPESLLHSQQGVSPTNKQGMVDRRLVKLYRFSDYPVPVHLKGLRRFIGRRMQAVSEALMCKNSETRDGGGILLFPLHYRRDTLRRMISCFRNAVFN